MVTTNTHLSNTHVPQCKRTKWSSINTYAIFEGKKMRQELFKHHKNTRRTRRKTFKHEGLLVIVRMLNRTTIWLRRSKIILCSHLHRPERTRIWGTILLDKNVVENCVNVICFWIMDTRKQMLWFNFISSEQKGCTGYCPIVRFKPYGLSRKSTKRRSLCFRDSHESISHKQKYKKQKKGTTRTVKRVN